MSHQIRKQISPSGLGSYSNLLVQFLLPLQYHSSTVNLPSYKGMKPAVFLACVLGAQTCKLLCILKTQLTVANCKKKKLETYLTLSGLLLLRQLVCGDSWQFCCGVQAGVIFFFWRN